MGVSMVAVILDGLNRAQHEAVVHEDGPLLILAGAGTGKTRTITRRVAHLVSHLAVPPGRILAITFTNKAAREMRERIAEWVPDAGLWVGTFHATCARMLRMDAEVVGRTRNFTIMDVDDRRRLLRQLIKDQGWDPTVYRPRKFEQFISNWKQQSFGPQQAAENASLYGMEEERAALVYEKYEEQLAKQGGLDFDDLLLKGVELLKKDRDGTRRWVDRFEHILVDEYQDTNELQYNFVRMLSAAHNNLAVLLKQRQVARVICSFVGGNPDLESQMLAGEVEVQLNPQGTLAERLRAGGAGIEAFFTPTGAGTLVAEGKEVRTLDGRPCVLETALKPDVAIVRAARGDALGNLQFYRTARNFNPLAAMAGRVTVAEVDELVPAGAIDPDHVHLPGIFVQRVVHVPEHADHIEYRTTRPRP